MTDAMSLEVTAAAMEPLVVLHAVADPIRWTVLATLAQAPRGVCKLQEQVPIAGNLLSYHLKVLREAGLVTTTRRGRWIDYALADDAPARMRASLPVALVAVPACSSPLGCGPGPRPAGGWVWGPRSRRGSRCTR